MALLPQAGVAEETSTQKQTMIRKKHLLTFALALTAGAALAEPPEGQAPPPSGKDGGPGPKQGEHRPPPPLVKALDLDGDGTISATEIDQAPESLKKLDKNGDGKLTMDELRPPRRDGEGPKGPGDKDQPRGPRADGQDGKGGPRDGGAERKGPRDGNKGPGQDGGPAAKQGDAPDGPDKGGPQGDRKRPVPPLMSVLDADGDGVISADEIAGAAVSLRKLDKNGDGKLTPDEYHPEPPKRDGKDGDGPRGKRGEGKGPKPDGDGKKE